MRENNRKPYEIRPIKITPQYIKHHPGSVLVEFGNTKVLTVAISEGIKLPSHRQSSKEGWISAEYNMLPGSTHSRSPRQHANNRVDKRSIEISRLISRSLRQAVNFSMLGPLSVMVDCDVLQADGGTRTAAITGAFVSLWLHIQHLCKKGVLSQKMHEIIPRQVAAISLGIFGDHILTDLDYTEDARAQADFTLVACDNGTIVELQGTAERTPIDRMQVEALIDHGLSAIYELCRIQKNFLN